MSKPVSSLKATFSHEVRPDVFIGRAWLTFWLALIVWSGMTVYKNGQVDASYLLPMPLGSWQAHDPAGGLYVETWATILVDSLQAGFGLWGVILLATGVWRAVTTHKAFISCFSLGGAFVGFVYFLPNWAPVLLKMVVEHYPFLAQ